MIIGGRGRSLTGAWIETYTTDMLELLDEVAPLRGRGLKRSRGPSDMCEPASLPYGGVD